MASSGSTDINLNRSVNVMISSGSPMSLGCSTIVNYQFSYLDFSQVQITEFKKDPGIAEDGGEPPIIDCMKGKNQLIYIHTIKMDDLPTSSSFSLGATETILSYNDAQKYKDLPCGIRTEQGTIIPQIIIPSDNYLGIENGLKFPNSDDFNLIHGKNEGGNTSTMDGMGYIWSAVEFNVNLQQIKDENQSSAYVEILKNKELYGTAEQLENSLYAYINNGNSLNDVLDRPSIATRQYKLDISKDANEGAFAFCYKMKHMTAQGIGNTAEQQSSGPIISLIHPMSRTVLIKKKKRNDFTSKKYNYNDHEMALSIVIPGKGDIYAAVGVGKGSSGTNNIAHGGLSQVDKDFVPPQCLSTLQENACTPLIIYPTYAGVIITNSIIKNALTGTDQIFVGNGLNNVKNELYVAEAKRSAQIIAYTKGDLDYDLKWFPTLVQEAREPLKIQLALRRVITDTFVKNEEITLKWIKSVGNFAYVPIFFHKNLEFSLFFKGNTNSNGNNLAATTSRVKVKITSSGEDEQNKYYVYPIINYIGKDDDYDSDVIAVVSSYFNDKDTKVNAAIPFQVGSQCFYDSDTQQTIYRADFLFKTRANKNVRYPLQVFGAAIVNKTYGKPFSMENSNGSFNPTGLKLHDSVSSYSKNFFDLITKCDISLGLDGVTGKLSLDGYICKSGIDIFSSQYVGELDLDVVSINESNENNEYNGYGSCSINPHPAIFKGYAMQIARDNSQNSYNIGINLYGAQKKMEDMKLICAPFWDGDRLEMICQYFEAYMNLKLKMISSITSNFESAVQIRQDQRTESGNWYTISSPVITETTSNDTIATAFRVPRSVNWETPSQNFVTGTSCLEALKKLAQDTSCVFTIGLDGIGYFYQLNNYGIPYYVKNQDEEQIVKFYATDIISISLSPVLSNKFNSIATFGFLQHKTRDDKTGGVKMENAVMPSVQYTKIESSDKERAGNITFPWTRAYVSVQNGFFTNVQLYNLHENKIKFAISQIYQGSMTVPGNTLVYHLYQKIEVLGKLFFVISIDHSIDLSSKQWTTTYGLNYFNDWTEEN